MLAWIWLEGYLIEQRQFFSGYDWGIWLSLHGNHYTPIVPQEGMGLYVSLSSPSWNVDWFSIVQVLMASASSRGQSLCLVQKTSSLNTPSLLLAQLQSLDQVYTINYEFPLWSRLTIQWENAWLCPYQSCHYCIHGPVGIVDEHFYLIIEQYIFFPIFFYFWDFDF